MRGANWRAGKQAKHAMKTKPSMPPALSMKRLALLGALSLSVLPLAAQVPVPPPPGTTPPTALGAPPPPPGPVQAIEHHRKPHHGPDTTPEPELQHLDGVVRQYLLNPDGEADGLLLTDGTQVRFPPHMSPDLVRTIKPGATVSVEGRRETPRAFRAYTITDNASQTTVIESRPSTPRHAPAGRAPERRRLEAVGKISLLLTAPHGETDGAVLENGSILRFRPEVADRFVQLLVSGQSITARGLGTENTLGRCLEISEIGEPGRPPVPAGPPEPGAAPAPLRP